MESMRAMRTAPREGALKVVASPFRELPSQADALWSGSLRLLYNHTARLPPTPLVATSDLTIAPAEELAAAALSLMLPAVELSEGGRESGGR